MLQPPRHTLVSDTLETAHAVTSTCKTPRGTLPQPRRLTRTCQPGPQTNPGRSALWPFHRPTDRGGHGEKRCDLPQIIKQAEGLGSLTRDLSPEPCG